MSGPVLGVANGGTGLSSVTAGSVLFGNPSTGLATSTGLTWNSGTSTLSATNLLGNGSGISSINAGNISSGTLNAARLPNSGVSAGTYGSGSAVPVITVDSTGRVTSATTSTVAGASTSVAGIVQLSDSTADTSSSKAATTYAVKQAYDLAYTANTSKVSLAGGDTISTTLSVNGLSYLYGGVSFSGYGLWHAHYRDGYGALIARNSGYNNYAYIAADGNSWSSVSDARLKTNVSSLSDCLNTVMKMNPVSFNWKEGTQRKQFGLIAQEVYDVMPSVVSNHETSMTDSNAFMGIEYTQLISPIIGAIKELKIQLNSLQETVSKALTNSSPPL